MGNDLETSEVPIFVTSCINQKNASWGTKVIIYNVFTYIAIDIFVAQIDLWLCCLQTSLLITL